MKEVTYDLPSRGYLEVSPCAKVVTREYLVEEEKGLFSSNRPFQKLLNLVGSTIVWAEDSAGQEMDPKKIQVTDWPYADFLHSLCRLRAVSDQDLFEFTLPCTNCKQPVPFAVELTAEGLETTYLEEGETSVEYTGEIDMGGDEQSILTCRHVLVKNHITLDNIMKKRKVKAGRNWDNGFTLRISNQLVAIDGIPFKVVNEAEQWLLKLTKRQRTEITGIFQKNTFGDDLNLALECDSCGHLDTVMMPISDKEFLFRESEVKNKRR